jgi:SAM-dependent methyltransferase
MSTKPAIRHSKPLDMRQHKREWLDIKYLQRHQEKYAHFSKYILGHPKKISVDECYICGSKDSTYFGTTYDLPYHQCSHCEHVYAKVCLAEEDLAEYYSADYFVDSTYLDVSHVKDRTELLVAPKIKYIAEFVKSSRRRWLDVGAGSGGSVAYAKSIGFDAHGIEPGENAVAFGKKMYDVELSTRSLKEELAVSGKESFDVVSFFLVLEHVRNPFEMVTMANELLPKGGLLVIEVPKADSVAAMGDIAYPGQAIRQLMGDHIMNYSMKSLQYLTDKNGFDIEGIWYMGQDVFNLVIHMALQQPSFLQSALCNFFIDNNNALQEVIDKKELSDEVIIVARKR